eukprot:9338446-Alexandrium_andersonii.AAC.1
MADQWAMRLGFYELSENNRGMPGAEDLVKNISAKDVKRQQAIGASTGDLAAELTRNESRRNRKGEAKAKAAAAAAAAAVPALNLQG